MDLSQTTLALHGDDSVDFGMDAAPPLHLSTAFKYSNEAESLIPIPLRDPGSSDFYYSRISAPTTERFEALLGSMLYGNAVAYPSGLSAFHAALILLNPKRVSIQDDLYFGCRGVIEIVSKMSGLEKISLDCEAEELQTGDLVVLETPLSPSGRALNISYYAEKAHSRGAYLLVSSTFAPPGLQNPFAFGADLVMHSGSKYIGGHSDLTCGVLAVMKNDWARELRKDRSILGNSLGGLESWLGLRSLRTLPIRVQHQSKSTMELVRWLHENLESSNESILKSAIAKVDHTSLQTTDFHWLLKQMPQGFGSVFSITMQTENMARQLPGKLRLFKHHTSFGGVVSSIEWRKMSDIKTDGRLLRLSIGLENVEDLKGDILSGMRSVLESSHEE